MGIAYYPDDGIDSEALLHAADTAMYAMKKSRQEPIIQCRGQIYEAV
jgi:GGDEF domain-containing protein